MNNQPAFSVAVPWSLSHYIPLNGFHPLYRALFDHAPATINLVAWDNVRLHRRFRDDASIRNAVVGMAKKRAQQSSGLTRNSVRAKYCDYFLAHNQVLTAELFGDIEFHHTAPFPSLQRPFVLHCEMFAPVLFPFAHQGTGGLDNHEEVREHYRNILGHPLCLGIWSHVPETLQSLRLYFSDPAIDRKLFHSRIGLSACSLPDAKLEDKPPLSRPRFLFINSAHQRPGNFFKRGGGIVLRFWKDFLTDRREGLLVLRCERPTDEDLIRNGVDVSMVRAETGRSIIWAEDYLLLHELNALMESAHFFLLPSAALHSVSIMQAMLMGTIPVVTDTVGTSVYVNDHETGIVLQGVRDAFWYEDRSTGTLMDRYCRIPEVDDSLVSQLSSRVGRLLDNPAAYSKMRDCALAHAKKEFSGMTFSNQFWSVLSDIYQQHVGSSVRPDTVTGQTKGALRDCEIQGRSDEWARVFESPTQPMRRINTGQSVVLELGGAVIHAYGNPKLELNDWSVLAQYDLFGAPRLSFAYTLEELTGRYLSPVDSFGNVRINEEILWALKGASLKIITWIARTLKPFPSIYRKAAWVLARIRRIRHWVLSGMPWPKAEADVELIWQGVSGYNVIRFADRYYAIPQAEGEFFHHKAKLGGYSSCFSHYEVENVLRHIAEHQGSHMQSGAVSSGLNSKGIVKS